MTTFAATTNGDAFSILRSQASASGVVLGTLSDTAAVALTVANILGGGASAETVPAGNVTSGTFGSVSSDVGIYSFRGAITGAGGLTISSGTTAVQALTGTTAVFSSTLESDGVVGFGSAPASSNALRIAGGVTAGSGAAVGLRLLTTLTAAANSDTLGATIISPTFTPGAFTGVAGRGITLSPFSVAAFTSPADPVGIDVGIITGTGATNAFGIRVAPPTGATNNYLIAHTTASVFSVTAAGLLTASNVTLTGFGSGSGVVSLGAADSGGAGFKVLRVPN